MKTEIVPFANFHYDSPVSNYEFVPVRDSPITVKTQAASFDEIRSGHGGL